MADKACCNCQCITDVQPYKDIGEHCWDCRETLRIEEARKQRKEAEEAEEAVGIKRFIE